MAFDQHVDLGSDGVADGADQIDGRSNSSRDNVRQAEPNGSNFRAV
jgi:hypothetical protein